MSDRSVNRADTFADRPLVVWCLSDGRAGHRRQIEGLVQQLQLRREVTVHWVLADGLRHWEYFGWWLRGRFPLGAALPCPQLIVGAGHLTHLAALAARRARGGKTIILMRPTLPTRLFDLCLVPEHDLESFLSRIDRCHVISTRGVLNPFVPSELADPGRALILIGGPSRHHGWSDQEILRQVRELIRLGPTQLTWTITSSRRTPPSILNRLAKLIRAEPRGPDVRIVSFAQTHPGWLTQELSRSRTVFVTEDSVSMVYEALTVGADVGLIEVPRIRKNSRNARCIDRVITDRFVIPFAEWQRTRFELRRQGMFHEASRCADIVCEQLLDAA